VIFETSGGSNKNIVHVDDDIACSDLFSEDGIHHRLEGGWGIGETKEHDCRLE
jgi:hypothetical protein